MTTPASPGGAAPTTSAPPSPPPPGPPPTPTPPGPPTGARFKQALDDFFDKPKKGETKAAEPPEPPEETPQETPAPADDKNGMPDIDKHFEDLTPTPKPAAKPEAKAPEPEVKPDGKGLRAALERSQSELSKREKRIAELQTELESQKKKPPVESEDSKLWKQERERYEERLKQLEGEVAAVDFTRSQEFQSEFQEPINQTYKSAISRIKSLRITDEEGNSRQATQDDFDQILQLPLDKAAEYAEKFGKGSSLVMNWRDRIEELAIKKNAEVTRRREKGSEYMTERQRAVEDMAKSFRENYDTRWKTQVEKLPQLYAPDEKDEAGNKYLDEDRMLVDFAFESTPQDAKLEQVAAARAEVGLRAMAFRRAMYRLNNANQEISALKEKLAAYEGSQPGTGQPARNGDTPKKPKTLFDAIDALPPMR